MSWQAKSDEERIFFLQIFFHFMFYFPNKVVFAVPADEKQEKKKHKFCVHRDGGLQHFRSLIASQHWPKPFNKTH